jgi:GT2 family glycosyltransferase
MSAEPTCDSVAVVVISHNYGRFLAAAVDSVLAQDSPPAEVLVVDDSSTDDTAEVAVRYAARGVRYVRVEHRDVQLSRRAGLRATAAPLLCFLDADDTLPPDYLRAARDALRGNVNVAIAYTDMRTFGDYDEHATLPPDARTADIARVNYIHAGSVVRRCAIETTNGLEPPVAAQHADWQLWRRLMAAGWRAVKTRSVYNYRRHSACLSTQVLRRGAGHFVAAGLAHAAVDIVIPFSGRLTWWPRLRDWLNHQTWPREQCRLLFIDTAQSPLLAHELRTWLAASNYQEFQYAQVTVGAAGLADAPRTDSAVYDAVQLAMPRIYAAAQHRVAAPFVFILEDDVHPPADAIEQLMRCVDSDTASVSGVYRSRYRPGWVVHTADNPAGELRTGVESVSSNGFGCLLLRAAAFKSVMLRGGSGAGDYDFNFYADLFAQNRAWVAKVNWDVRCAHGDIDATGELPPPPAPLPQQVPLSRVSIVPNCASDTRLAVLTAVFGAKARPRENYHRFVAATEAAGVPVFVIECAIGNAAFWVPDRPGLVRVRAPHVGWHKERLLNILEQVVPPRFTKLAWLDADVLFDDPAWAAKAETLLDQHPVIQLFDSAAWLQPDNTAVGRVWSGFAAAFASTRIAPSEADAHPGFAWAMQRDLWRQHGGLLDRAATMGADSAMAYAWCGCEPPAVYVDGSQVIAKWCLRARRLVAGRVGALPGRIRHLWHGPYGWRQYGRLRDSLAAAGWTGDGELVADAQYPLQLPYRLARPHVFEPVYLDFFAQRGDDVNMPYESL